MDRDGGYWSGREALALFPPVSAVFKSVWIYPTPDCRLVQPVDERQRHDHLSFKDAVNRRCPLPRPCARVQATATTYTITPRICCYESCWQSGAFPGRSCRLHEPGRCLSTRMCFQHFGDVLADMLATDLPSPGSRHGASKHTRRMGNMRFVMIR